MNFVAKHFKAFAFECSACVHSQQSAFKLVLKLLLLAILRRAWNVGNYVWAIDHLELTLKLRAMQAFETPFTLTSILIELKCFDIKMYLKRNKSVCSATFHNGHVLVNFNT